MTPDELRRLSQHFRSLQKTLESIETQLEAIAKQSKADAGYEKPTPQKPADLVVSLPPSIAAYYDAENNERPSKLTWGRIQRVVEIGGLLTVVAYAIVTTLSLGEIKKQSASAQKQVALMQRQLEVVGRPWLGLNASVNVERITVSNDDIGADLIVPVKNYGASPATHVGVDVIIRTEDHPEELSQQFRNASDIVCMGLNELSPDRRRGVGVVIFPGLSVPHPMGIGVSGGPVNPHDTLQIIGCIAYEFPAEKTHHTRFCLESHKPAGEFRAGDPLFSCRFGNTAD
jgi:hypothetical protein